MKKENSYVYGMTILTHQSTDYAVLRIDALPVVLDAIQEKLVGFEELEILIQKTKEGLARYLQAKDSCVIDEFSSHKGHESVMNLEDRLTRLRQGEFDLPPQKPGTPRAD